ncbi:MAG: RHS repeat protein [Lysobacter sp.]|nr:RHS repeat protein [Lysobacter sp.]
MEISHLYDAAGRARSESRTFTDEAGQRRTLTTQYRYDDKGRLVETIDHANRTTRTEYNAIDKVSAQVDALGRRTEMVYDARGNHTETHYPDGTSEITVYDTENRVVAKIDRGQRTTTYVHDDAGRVVETRHPDSSIETVRYDKAGREISRTDARSNTTTFVYDTVHDEEHLVAGSIRRQSACFFGVSQRSMRCCASRTKSVNRVAALASR